MSRFFLITSLLAARASNAIGLAAPSVNSPISQRDWDALNHTVGGRMGVGVPFSRSCFSRAAGGAVIKPNQTQCAEVQIRNEDHLFRSDNFGAYEITQWETCQTSGDECLLDWTSPANPAAFLPPRQCLQGNVPSYYIDISGPEDVRAAFDFTRRTKVPIVIKNSGHDYLGRSAGREALALWTHNLNKMVLNRKFTPEGCSSGSTTAITIGAGQQFHAIYEFARANNVTVVGGADPSVGASGGWVMGGGHSALSPVLGLGVDRVLEFKIVTPDGTYRSVNRCQNQDLFFALRGGGGGTFGVVLESTFVVSPQMTVQAILGQYENTRTNSEKLLKALAGSAVQMATDGWGGYIQPTEGTGVWANPVLNSARAHKSAAAVTKAFESVNGTVTFFVMDSYTDFFNTFINPNPDEAGRPQVMATRLIPSEKMGDSALINSIIEAMLDSDFSQILAVTPFSFKDFKEGETSINPAWRNAVWHTLVSYNWNFNSTLSDRVGQYQKLTEKWATVRNLTPDAGVYFNEADVYEPDYTNAFWGENYPRLLSIKQKYDPDHILDCWHCGAHWRKLRDVFVFIWDTRLTEYTALTFDNDGTGWGVAKRNRKSGDTLIFYGWGTIWLSPTKV